MCGLAGLWQPFPSSAEQLGAAAQAMATAIAHRGPDDAGLWCDPEAGLALAHRRLAILDLSPAGHQPMLSASGRYVIAFNGEIYNHLALRHELERLACCSRPGAAIPTPKPCWPPLRPGDWKPPCSAAPACSPWPCGTGASAGCSWPVIALAKSRSIGAGCSGGPRIAGFGSELAALRALAGAATARARILRPVAAFFAAAASQRRSHCRPPAAAAGPSGLHPGATERPIGCLAPALVVISQLQARGGSLVSNSAAFPSRRRSRPSSTPCSR